MEGKVKRKGQDVKSFKSGKEKKIIPLFADKEPLRFR